MLKEREEVRNIGENADRTTAEIRFMEKLWIARIREEKTKKRCICRKSYGIKMILQKEALLDLGGQKRKLAIEIITKLLLI